MRNIIVKEGCWIGERVTIETTGDSKISLGRNTSIQNGCHLFGNIEMGENILLGPNVFISSGTHVFKEEPLLPIKEQDKKYNNNGKFDKKVTIEDDVWIGTNVFIAQGIKVNKGAIIGANSVINKDIAEYDIVVGNNRVIGNRRDY
ncbi:acyltransferase [Acetoanaerobium sticklandii]|uniref:acyltransferase n=1 Tax=Acetoanaerobium sticklandii TaxID=1511 RepID=UPI003A90E533